MNIEKIKELYSKGWTIITKNPVEYEKINNPVFERFNGSEIAIAPYHEHILDAWLELSEVYRFIRDGDIGGRVPSLEKNFIENYSSKFIYKAVPKSLENCYCKANEFNYNKLIKTHTLIDYATKKVSIEHDYFIGCKSDMFTLWGRFDLPNQLSDKLLSFKKIEYNEQIKQWIYCSYGEKENKIKNVENILNDLGIEHDGNTEESNGFNNANEVIEDIIKNTEQFTQEDANEFFHISTSEKVSYINPNVQSNNKANIIKPNNFKDYGFEADFEGEILKQIEDEYIGWYRQDDYIQSYTWSLDGKSTCGHHEHNLTLIKKEWYEDEENLGKLAYNKERDLFGKFRKYNNLDKTVLLNNTYWYVEHIRLATKEEINNLFYKEK